MVSSRVDSIRSDAGDAKRAFIRARDRQLRLVRGERTTKMQAIHVCRRVFDRLSGHYHRIAGTTYAGWLAWGPKAEWDELLEAAADDALWDRLVERFDAREVSHVG